MKIDRIEVLYYGGSEWNWQAIDMHKDIRFRQYGRTNKEYVIAEARYLAKKLGCKLVLPEGKK